MGKCRNKLATWGEADQGAGILPRNCAHLCQALTLTSQLINYHRVLLTTPCEWRSSSPLFNIGKWKFRERQERQVTERRGTVRTRTQDCEPITSALPSPFLVGMPSSEGKVMPGGRQERRHERATETPGGAATCLSALCPTKGRTQPGAANPRPLGREPSTR